MTGPVSITKKPEYNTAFQFTGGVENASAIDTWLEVGLAAQRMTGTAIVLHTPAAAEEYEGDVLVKAAVEEHLALFTTSGRLTVAVGSWILLDPVAGFKILNDTNFAATYDIVEAGNA